MNKFKLPGPTICILGYFLMLLTFYGQFVEAQSSCCATRPLTRRYSGQRGGCIFAVQGLLNAYQISPLLAVDGIFGPLTEGNVRKFQVRYGLLVDGIVGPQTWGRLCPVI